MKIAQILSHAGHGNGVVSSCVDLLNALLERGHELVVVHRPDAWISKQKFPGQIAFAACDMGTRVIHFRQALRAYRMLAGAAVDVIHTHGSMAHNFGAIFRAVGGIPVVATAHNRLIQPHWAFNNAVIAPSSQTARFHHRYNLVSRRRIHVIAHMLSESAIPVSTGERRQTARQQFGLGEGAFVIGSVGHICTRKNQSLAVEIVRRVAAAGADAHCVLVGAAQDGEIARVEKLRGDPTLKGRVHVMGYRPDARALLAGFDAFLCTSRVEEGPIAVLEAMAAGLPVYSTDVGSASQMIEPAANGLIFDPRDTAGLVDSLLALSRSAERREAYGARSRQIVTERFAPERIVRQIEALYSDVAAKSRSTLTATAPSP